MDEPNKSDTSSLPPKHVPSSATTLHSSESMIKPRDGNDGVVFDELWDMAVRNSLQKLSAKDAAWLCDKDNQTPLTSTKLIETIRAQQSTYNKHLAQRLLARLNPIISHLRSFAKVISIFARADQSGASIIWGSVYLCLQTACRNQKDLEIILDLLTDIGTHLSLFSRWRLLFPQKSYAEVGESIKTAYEEIVIFCIDAVRYFRHNPISNLFLTLVKPLEHQLSKHESRIRRCMARVREEVDTAHMEHVHNKLAAIPTAIDSSPTPRFIEIPTIRIIPHSRNHHFFGRKGILHSISSLQTSGSSPRQKRFTLAGPGGSGKTQIALEYSYSNLDEYKAIIWILADSPEKISQGFEDVAEQLGMPKGTQSSRQIQSFVLTRLSTTSEKYLLCFDNADDLSLIRDCFPRANNGFFIITIRDSAAASNIATETLMVPEFSRDEGRAFLRSLLPPQTYAATDSDVCLDNICEIFHGYPLALAQVAGFIRSGGFSLVQFLAKLRDTRSFVNTAAIASTPITDYHADLVSVWTMSFASLSLRSQQILRILVYLDPDSIAFELFREGCMAQKPESMLENLAYLADPVALRNALDGLRAQSLIRANPDLQTISIHRFFQDQASQYLTKHPDQQRQAFVEALYLLQNLQPGFPNVTRHWSPDLFKASELCLPHIKRLASKFRESPEIFIGYENDLGKLISESASYQFERFHHHAATETFELARSIIQKSSTPNVLTLSDCYRMEGRMFNESGRPVPAEESNRKAEKYAKIATARKLISPDDQRMPRILTGLGNSLSQLERYDEALEAQLEAKRLCGDVPPEQSDAVTIIQLNFGFLMYRRGDLDTAESILRNTLEANPSTPPALYALGNTLLQKGKIEEALATHLEGLEIYIRMFGDQHALVGRATYKVGEILLLHQKDHLLARMYLRKALNIYRKQESPYYTEKAYARAARMLAKCFEIDGMQNDASYYYQQAWELRKRIDGIEGSARDTDKDYWSPMFYWDQ